VIEVAGGGGLGDKTLRRRGRKGVARGIRGIEDKVSWGFKVGGLLG